MELYRQPGSKFWTADFCVNGRRYRKSTKQTTRSKAGEVAAEFLRQAQRKRHPSSGTGRNTAGVCREAFPAAEPRQCQNEGKDEGVLLERLASASMPINCRHEDGPDQDAAY